MNTKEYAYDIVAKFVSNGHGDPNVKASEIVEIVAAAIEQYNGPFSSDIKPSMEFAEWLDIEGIRADRHAWKYKGDNYEKKHTTEEMFHEWQRLMKEKAEKRYYYKCKACGSTYTDLKEPLDYSDCQALVELWRPEPEMCGGKLVETDKYGL
jgi:murein L,D-transpeptidase YcbB/YkuD